GARSRVGSPGLRRVEHMNQKAGALHEAAIHQPHAPRTSPPTLLANATQGSSTSAPANASARHWVTRAPVARNRTSARPHAEHWHPSESGHDEGRTEVRPSHSHRGCQPEAEATLPDGVTAIRV